MNQAHIHLIVNHVPIVGSLFALILLAAGLLCLLAQLTGEGATKIVQDMPRVSRALIEAHAAAAELGFWVLESAAALALFSFLLLKNASPKARLLALLTLVVAVLSFGLLARAGYLGGQIRHTEIRDGFGTPDEL